MAATSHHKYLKHVDSRCMCHPGLDLVMSYLVNTNALYIHLLKRGVIYLQCVRNIALCFVLNIRLRLFECLKKKKKKPTGFQITSACKHRVVTIIYQTPEVKSPLHFSQILQVYRHGLWSGNSTMIVELQIQKKIFAAWALWRGLGGEIASSLHQRCRELCF